jgi:hypothetical protein
MQCWNMSAAVNCFSVNIVVDTGTLQVFFLVVIFVFVFDVCGLFLFFDHPRYYFKMWKCLQS